MKNLVDEVSMLVGGILAVIALVVGWLFFAPASMGGMLTYVIVNGKSMEPNFHRGDLVLVKRESSYTVGDAVVYTNREMNNSYVFHRIVAVEGDRFVLRGDNNQWDDGYKPTSSEVLGKLWLNFAEYGKMAEWIRKPTNLAWVGAALSLMFVGDFIGDNSKKNSNANNKKRFRKGAMAPSFSSTAGHTMSAGFTVANASSQTQQRPSSERVSANQWDTPAGTERVNYRTTDSPDSFVQGYRPAGNPATPGGGYARQQPAAPAGMDGRWNNAGGYTPYAHDNGSVDIPPTSRPVNPATSGAGYSRQQPATPAGMDGRWNNAGGYASYAHDNDGVDTPPTSRPVNSPIPGGGYARPQPANPAGMDGRWNNAGGYAPYAHDNEGVDIPSSRPVNSPIPGGGYARPQPANPAGAVSGNKNTYGGTGRPSYSAADAGAASFRAVNNSTMPGGNVSGNARIMENSYNSDMPNNSGGVGAGSVNSGAGSSGSVSVPSSSYSTFNESTKLAVAGLAVLCVLFIALGIYAFSTPTEIVGSNLPYQLSGTYSYSAAGTPGINDANVVRPGEPIFPSLTCILNVDYAFSMTGDQITNVSGVQNMYARVLEPGSGWTRTIPLVAETYFTDMSHVLSSPVDLCVVKALVDKVEEETGLTSGVYTLEIVNDIRLNANMANTPVSENFVSSLYFNYNKNHFFVALAADDTDLDPFKNAKGGAVPSQSISENTISMLGLPMPVWLVRILAVISALITLTVFGMMAYAWYQENERNEAAMIRLKFGTMVVDVREQILSTSTVSIDLGSMEDLARLAEMNQTMIFHMKKDSMHYYFFQANGTMYRYSVSDTSKYLTVGNVLDAEKNEIIDAAGPLVAQNSSAGYQYQPVDDPFPNVKTTWQTNNEVWTMKDTSNPGVHNEVEFVLKSEKDAILLRKVKLS